MNFSAIIQTIFSMSFLCAAVVKGIPLLYGALGEILTEKSGHLNLGIPGIMYMGGIGGLTGAYIYEKFGAVFNPNLAILIAILCALLFALIGGLIYSFLTITLRVNQNVSGLALTTFGVGLGNFLGGSLAKLAGTVGSIAVRSTGAAFKRSIFGFYTDLGWFGQLFLSYGILTYLAIALAILAAWFLAKTRIGLNLRAVGEDPAAADAAGINVIKYKYIAILLGSGIAGLGGLYFVMEYIGGVWQNNALGDTGWLAIALVIFALWKPARAIWGAILFGGLCVLYNYINVDTATQELIKMLPYIVTIVVLVLCSLRKKKENQPPAHLGLPYFREDR